MSKNRQDPLTQMGQKLCVSCMRVRIRFVGKKLEPFEPRDVAYLYQLVCAFTDLARLIAHLF